jgi:hypothetical protein
MKWTQYSIMLRSSSNIWWAQRNVVDVGSNDDGGRWTMLDESWIMGASRSRSSRVVSSQGWLVNVRYCNRLEAHWKNYKLSERYWARAAPLALSLLSFQYCAIKLDDCTSLELRCIRFCNSANQPGVMLAGGNEREKEKGVHLSLTIYVFVLSIV